MNSSSCSSPQLNQDNNMSMEIAETDALLSLKTQYLKDTTKLGFAPSLMSVNKAASMLSQQDHRKTIQLIESIYGSSQSLPDKRSLQQQNFGFLPNPFLINDGSEFGSLKYFPSSLPMSDGYAPNPIWSLLGNQARMSDRMTPLFQADNIPHYSSLMGLLNLRQQSQSINIDLQNRQEITSRPSSFVTKIESQPNIHDQINIFNQNTPDYHQIDSQFYQFSTQNGKQSQTGYKPLSQNTTSKSQIGLVINGNKRETTFTHQPYTDLTRLLQNPTILNEFSDILANKPSPLCSQLLPAETLKYRRMLYQQVLESQSLRKNEEKCEESEQETTEKIVETVESIRRLGLPRSIRQSQVLLNSIAIEAPQKEYTVYKDLMKMCEQFIRGEKRKRFKQRNIDSQYMSRFHNLNRLFFYQIVSIYNYQSISCFNLPTTIASQLLHVISQVKIHSKLQPVKPSKDQSLELSIKRSFADHSKGQTDSYEEKEPQLRKMLNQTKKLLKSEDTESMNISSSDDQEVDDFPIRDIAKNYQTLKVEAYTHSHYNVLFLALTPASMESLKHSKKDIEAHWLAYKIDLRKPSEISSEKLEYANLMKGLFYKIFLHFNSVTESTSTEFRAARLEEVYQEQQESQSDIDLKAIALRLDYYIRVAIGIQKLSEGTYSHKF